MLLVVKWNAVAVIRHGIYDVIEVFRVEDVADVREEGIGQPTNPAPLANQGIDVIGRRITL